MNPYLAATDIIDWTHPDVLARALALKSADGPVVTAENCFCWVRDEIHHSIDHGDRVVTLSASQVLQHRTGFCYGKSHLLAALLRANNIPAGLCYQRLCLDDQGPPFCLHGFNAIALPGMGWYRVDARGNRPGIETRFDPPREVLAFQPKQRGEQTFEAIWPEPLPVVVEALRRCNTVSELISQLPDCWVQALVD